MDLPLLKVIRRFYTLKWEFIRNTLDMVVSEEDFTINNL